VKNFFTKTIQVSACTRKYFENTPALSSVQILGVPINFSICLRDSFVEPINVLFGDETPDSNITTLTNYTEKPTPNWLNWMGVSTSSIASNVPGGTKKEYFMMRTFIANAFPVYAYKEIRVFATTAGPIQLNFIIFKTCTSIYACEARLKNSAIEKTSNEYSTYYSMMVNLNMGYNSIDLSILSKVRITTYLYGCISWISYGGMLGRDWGYYGYSDIVLDSNYVTVPTTTTTTTQTSTTTTKSTTKGPTTTSTTITSNTTTKSTATSPIITSTTTKSATTTTIELKKTVGYYSLWKNETGKENKTTTFLVDVQVELVTVDYCFPCDHIYPTSDSYSLRVYTSNRTASVLLKTLFFRIVGLTCPSVLYQYTEFSCNITMYAPIPDGKDSHNVTVQINTLASPTYNYLFNTNRMSFSSRIDTSGYYIISFNESNYNTARSLTIYVTPSNTLKFKLKKETYY
jgi:hypothetical protein